MLPVSKDFDGEQFFTLDNGRKVATPLLLVIALVGLPDIIFAVDSLAIDVIKIPLLISLGVVVSVLAITMIWSVKTAPKFGARALCIALAQFTARAARAHTVTPQSDKSGATEGRK